MTSVNQHTITTKYYLYTNCFQCISFSFFFRIIIVMFIHLILLLFILSDCFLELLNVNGDLYIYLIVS